MAVYVDFRFDLIDFISFNSKLRIDFENVINSKILK